MWWRNRGLQCLTVPQQLGLTSLKRLWCVTLPHAAGLASIIGVCIAGLSRESHVHAGTLVYGSPWDVFAQHCFLSKSRQSVEKLENVSAEQHAGTNPVRQIQNLQNKRKYSRPGTSAAPSSVERPPLFIHEWLDSLHRRHPEPPPPVDPSLRCNQRFLQLQTSAR